METEVASGRTNCFDCLASRDPVPNTGNLTEGAEIVPAIVMEKVDEATTLLAELPANLMLQVVGAVVSARFEVHIFYLMQWNSHGRLVAAHKASAVLQCAMLAKMSIV